ncbi:MAG: hypothetical protein C0597_01055 [Marinilabiliales bacterium]|nr:MAG: hypothetical protein C0597_01055 [Marinilabiliales bacterium]
MFCKRFIIFFIALVLPFLSKSQFTRIADKGIGFEVDYGYGFIMPHHQSIEYMLEDHIQTFDFKLTFPTYGNKYWNDLYRYPYYGFGFYRLNLGNDEVFGKVNALYSYVKVPFIGDSDKANLSWQIAFGASYISDHFDIDENPQNLAIGSNLNIYVDFSLQSRIPLSKQFSLMNSVRFTHVSNGKVKSPNKGLNILSGSLGIYYQFKETPERVILETQTIPNKNEYLVVYAGAIKSKTRYEPGYYYASSLVFDFNRNYSFKGRWGAGVDIFFDETNDQFSDNTEKANIVNSELYQIGLHAGHDLVMGQLSLVFNVGAYIYAPVYVDAPIYSRVGLRYRIKDKFIINYTLKSHWAMASYIEWGIGYVFN